MSKLDLWLRGFSPTARYEGEGDMNAEHLKTLLVRPTKLVLRSTGAEQDVDDRMATEAARAELKAMETPITPETLDEALWQKGSDGVWYYPIDYANGQFVEVSFRDAKPDVSVVFHDSAIKAKGVKTMHDLFVLYAALRGDE